MPYMASLVRPEGCASQAVRAEVRLRPVATQPQGTGAVSQQLTGDVRDRGSGGVAQLHGPDGSMAMDNRIK